MCEFSLIPPGEDEEGKAKDKKQSQPNALSQCSSPRTSVARSVHSIC